MYPYFYFVIPSYTLLAFIGGTAALFLVYTKLERYQVQFTSFLYMALLCFLGAIAGSKILFAITQIPWLINNFSFINLVLLIPQSGFVFYGGLFGVIAALMFATRKDADYRRRVFRMVVPSMPLFHAFGRIGCFLAGCCYGKSLATPLMIGGIELTRVPVQILETFLEFILFIVITVIEKKRANVDLLKFYLIVYAIIRFCDEFLRGDEIRGIFFGLSTAQWISIAIIVVYFIKDIMKKRRLNV